MLSKYMYSVSTLPFAKGPKQPPEPTRVSDNLRSEDTVEVLLGLGEGPWSKLHDGMKSFYIANTPLMASDGTLNFPDAQLIFHKGTQMPDPIKFLLGGSASGHSVGVNLAQNAPVTRTTTSGDIDAIDVRIRIDQLMRNTTDGDQLNEDLLFRIEVKPTSSGTWQTLPSNTGWLQSYTHPDPVDSGSGIFGTLRSRIEELRIEQGFTQFQAEAQAWAEYQDNADGPIDTSLGVTAYSDNVRVYGRTQSPVMKEIRIPVARLATDTYDIRVTKISAESTSTSIRELTWDTFEQITIEEKSYPNTAMAQLIVKASDQLSNIPQMYGIYDTAEVLVPTIFDPVTRSYDFTGGPWDGTFKKVFTDDLAWIIYDLVHNDVHGIAAYHTINFSRYEALEASLYWNACDEVTGAYVGVPRPNGGTRPRVTFNGSITTPRNSMELLTYMAGAGNAVFYEDVEGNFRLRVERNTTATHTFNNMDIENGRFQYSFSDINTRYNDITVVYRNKLLPAYQEDRRRVFDQADIDLHGRKPLTFVAVGCVDTDEAINRAYHKLVTSLTETRNVAFTTTRLGAYVEPHDIILIADEAMDEGHSRRCMDISSDRRTLTYNEPLVLESGVTDYKVRIQTKDGIWETNVIWGSVATTPTTVRLEDALPTDLGLDPNFSFSVASATEGDLRPYRVIGIEEGDDANEKIKITALEVNRSKYALVDNFDGTVFDVSDEPDISSPDSTAVLELTANVLERVTSDGKVNDINLTWEPPSTAIAGGKYSVKYTFNDGQSREIFRGSAQQFSMAAVDAGTHLFAVNALNVDGSESPQIVRTRVTTVAPFYGLPSITGVTIQNKKDSDTTYIGRNVSLEWSVDTTEKWEGWASDKPHPDFAWFEVDVVNPSNGSIVHTYQVNDWSQKKLEIPYSEFSTYGLTTVRDFSVVVSVSDAQGNEGSTFTRNINKPALTLQNVAFAQVHPLDTRAKMKFDEPADSDYVGVNVWISTTASAHTTGTLAWNSNGNPVLDFADGTNHISYQVIDVFGVASSPITETTYDASITDPQSLIDNIEADVAANTQDVGNLTTIYGSTASAAQSAANALIAQSAAELASNNAQTAQTLSENAAAASETSRLASETAAGNSSSSETAAALSETNSAGSASSAATSATNAAGSENAAGLSATAASISAGSAATSANESSTSATAAASSALLAEVASKESILLFDDPLMQYPVERWGVGPLSFNLETLTNYQEVTRVTGVSDSIGGAVLSANGGALVLALRAIEIDTSKTYKLSGRVRQVTTDGSAKAFLGFQALDENFTNIGSVYGTLAYPLWSNETLPSTWQDREAEISGEGSGLLNFPTGTKYIRLGGYINNNVASSTGIVQIDKYSIEDITESKNAAISAAASITAAASASASETAAGQSAIAAQLAETNAGTSASNASVSEGNAALSETNASGSAAAAAASQVLSAQINSRVIELTPDPYMTNCLDNWVRTHSWNTVDSNGSLSTNEYPVLRRPTVTGSLGGAVMELVGENSGVNNRTAFHKSAIPVDTSRTYRMTFRGMQNTSGGGRQCYIGLQCLDENYQNIAGFGGTFHYVIANNEVWPDNFTERSVELTGEVNRLLPKANRGFPIGTKYVRPMILVNYPTGIGSFLVDYVDIKDITEEARARGVEGGLNNLVSGGMFEGDPQWVINETYSAGNHFDYADEVGEGRILQLFDSITTGNRGVGSPAFKLTPLNRIKVGVRAKSNVSGVDGFYLVLSMKGSHGKYLGVANAVAHPDTVQRDLVHYFMRGENDTLTSSYQDYEFEYTVPAGMEWASISAVNWSQAVSDISVSRMWVYDIEESYQSQLSASASATSAGSAAVSETNAGSFASASQVSATNAAASEASASTSASQSSVSAGQAASSATTASNQATAAAGYASSASSSAASANSSAVSATNIKNITAKIAHGLLNDNASFSDYSGGIPPAWFNWSSGNGTRVDGDVSENAFQLQGTANFAGGIRNPVTNITPSWYVMEADVVLVSGTFEGAGVVTELRQANGTFINNAHRMSFTSDPDASGNVVGNGVVGKRYRFAKLFDATYNLVGQLQPFAMSHWTGFGDSLASNNVIRFNLVGVRHATLMEIDAGRVVNIEASVTTNSTAIASNTGRLQAHWSVETAVTGAEAFIVARADQTVGGAAYSTVGIGADLFAVYNQVGSAWITALRVSGGDVRIAGNLEAGAGIYLGTGSGRWPVALQQRVYNETDGTVITFGTNVDIGDYDVDFSPIGLDELASGEAYRLRAINKTGTGFTAELKITTTGATVAVTASTNASSPSGPEQMVAKADTEAAYNDVYTFYISGDIDVFGFDEEGFGGGGGPVEYWGQIQVETWFHDGTSWVQGPTKTLTHYQLGINPNHGDGNQNYTFSNKPFTVTYTGGIRTSATLGTFGATETGSGALTNLNKVTYTKQGSSGTRSATPNGELCKITVKPENQSTA